MPMFNWEGLDVTGETRKGKDQASTPADLEKILHARGIAMLHAKKSFFQHSTAIGKPRPKKWPAADELFFFTSLAELLDAGIFISDAITLLAHQQKKKRLPLEAIKEQLDRGIPLSTALEPFALSPLILALTRAGEETASLPQTMTLIAHFLTQQQDFKSRIKTAIYTPAITLVFFVLISGVIIFGLIPKIAGLFPDTTKLPSALLILLAINDLPRHPTNLILLFALMTSTTLLCVWLATIGKPYWDHIVLQIPIINRWVINRSMANLLTSLAIMLDGGIPLSRALPIASQGINNTVIRAKLAHMVADIEMGTPLSDAARTHLELDELATVMALGEQTGRLAPLVARTARWYEQQCTDFLMRLSQAIQPMLIIFLGLGIAGLVAAVYLPILELAQGIPQGC